MDKKHENNHKHHSHSHIDNHSHGHIDNHGHGHKSIDDSHDDCCESDHIHSHGHSHSHNGNGACSCCDGGILDDIGEKQEKSKMPLIIMGVGVILVVLGILLKTYFQQYLPETLNLGFWSVESPIAILVFLIVVIIVGKDVIIHGFKSLFKKEVNMNLLMSIATIGAFLLGDGLEGASLMLLYYLAEYIECLALDRSKKSLSKLVNLNPEIAIKKIIDNNRNDDNNNNIEGNGKNINNNGSKKNNEIEVNVDDLKVNDIVIVRPGDKIPIDGIIVEGNTSINQASITGESLPVSKTVGDEVYSSTINEDGYIELKVTKTSKNTIFSKIIDLIKESEEKKAKINVFIDEFAKYYTPAVVLIAILVAIIPPIFFNQSLSLWVYKALVLLCISCPCALAISTPVSMVSAITAGTKNGIIIKGGEYIEELNKIKAILFDKTGTLTEGNLEITDIYKIADISKEEILKISASIEKKSNHPIAKAFNDYQKNHDIKLENVDNFKSISGFGVKGTINGNEYLIGKKELFNSKLFDNLQFNSAIKGKTSIFIGMNLNDVEFDDNGNDNGKNSIYKLIGAITLNDKIRKESKLTISSLKEKDIKTIMLTGDNKDSAEEVSSKLGLDKFYYNLLPENKLNLLDSLEKEYKYVAMVGDGVNDTPSLARANVGIAMGLEGSDVAVDTADIVLTNDKLSNVDLLIQIAKKTMNIIKQNVVLVISIKAILAILGVLGHLSLLEAIILGDVGLTLFVVLNSFRIGNK
ncbi:MAG: cation-translocating P-type ATPase [Methanobrevibacter sp.]|jgi:Cd2+/Zn2+-exporting ATPase|nr:cation-translocating P-type ATPase [Candidatus Methanoflexus mossambicus]